MMLLYFIKLNYLRVDGHFFIGIFSLLYAFVIFYQVSDYGTYINFIFCGILIAFYPTIFLALRSESFSLSIYPIIFLLSLYVFECVYRISNPIYTEAMMHSSNESLLFYQYKFNSFMFTDSNFVGLSLLSLYCIVDEFLKGERARILVKVTIFLLLLFTFSRAAYLSFFVYIVLKNSGYRLKVFLILSAGLASIVAVPLILNDGSFLSKMKILSYYSEFFNSSDLLQLLVGVGIGESFNVLGIGSHNLFVLLNVEFGIIGFFWFVALVVYNIFKTKFKTIPYWLAIHLCGFSLGVIYPFVFLPAIMIAYKKEDDA